MRWGGGGGEVLTARPQRCVSQTLTLLKALMLGGKKYFCSCTPCLLSHRLQYLHCNEWEQRLKPTELEENIWK